MKNNIAVVLVLLVASWGYGCATAQKMKSLPEENLYFSMYASPNKKEMLRAEIVSRHAEWSEDVRQTVLNGEIVLGMTKEQVKSSYGKPLEILQTTKGELEGHSLWIYPKAYLVFEQDKLVSSEEIIKIEMKPSLVEKVRYSF